MFLNNNLLFWGRKLQTHVENIHLSGHTHLWLIKNTASADETKECRIFCLYDAGILFAYSPSKGNVTFKVYCIKMECIFLSVACVQFNTSDFNTNSSITMLFISALFNVFERKLARSARRIDIFRLQAKLLTKDRSWPFLINAHYPWSHAKQTGLKSIPSYFPDFVSWLWRSKCF